MTPKAQLLARVLVAHVMDGYRLSPAERKQESERLLASIVMAVEAETENIEHRAAPERR
jgi:hypothetical protein